MKTVFKTKKEIFWKNFDTAENAFLELYFPGLCLFDFKSDKERLRAWLFNLNKFDNQLTDEQRKDFQREIDILKTKITAIKP